jgi:hypothetical protein
VACGWGRASIARTACVVILVAFVATACGAGGDPNGERERRSAAIETALASVQQYPGARLVDRHDGDTSSELQYELPTSVGGSQVQLHFRRLLASRGWRCSFNEHSAGEPYGFWCRREGEQIDGTIGDRGGYTLVVH